jgi:hypothetical protein
MCAIFLEIIVEEIQRLISYFCEFICFSFLKIPIFYIWSWIGELFTPLESWRGCLHVCELLIHLETKGLGSFLCESYTKGVNKCTTIFGNQYFVRINTTY